jgi:hypothetical protein
MSKVKIVADDNGNVIAVSKNNPEYGYVRLEQKSIQIDHNGWLKSVKRSTILKGKMEDLLQTGYTANTELPGKIIVKESLTPFNTDNPDRDLKIAGSTGVICRIDDEPIYRQSFYTTDMEAFDQLIPHNNNEEIKDVMYSQKEIDKLIQSDEASL